MTTFTTEEIWLVQQMAKTRCARIAGQMAAMEAIADKMQTIATLVTTMTQKDDELAKRLAPEYPMAYANIRRYIDGANGNESLARLALRGNTTVAALKHLLNME